jgi:hypothetical protein
MRAPGSCPWQAKHLADSTGRMSRLKSTRAGRGCGDETLALVPAIVAVPVTSVAASVIHARVLRCLRLFISGSFPSGTPDTSRSDLAHATQGGSAWRCFSEEKAGDKRGVTALCCRLPTLTTGHGSVDWFHPPEEVSVRYHLALITLVVGALLAATAPVHGSVSGRRNTALGATGIALYELARGRTGTGLVAAAGAGYSWHQYNRAHKRSTRRSAFLEGYRAGVRRSYRHFHGRRYVRR